MYGSLEFPKVASQVTFGTILLLGGKEWSCDFERVSGSSEAFTLIPTLPIWPQLKYSTYIFYIN